MAHLGGGAEAHTRFKQYEYRANSRKAEFPSGMYGKIDPKSFADRVYHGRPIELEVKLEEEIKQTSSQQGAMVGVGGSDPQEGIDVAAEAEAARLHHCKTMFDGFSAVMLPERFNGLRYSIISKKWQERHGELCGTIGKVTTHVIASSWEVVLKRYAWRSWKWHKMQETIKMVSFEWVTGCLSKGKRLPEEAFELELLHTLTLSAPRLRPHVMTDKEVRMSKRKARKELAFDDL